jgi:CheY-like chemotaxis protein
MGRILILEEAPGPMQALRKSLQGAHELQFAADPLSAIAVLEHEKIDLIIARVHLEQSNIFEFIRAVKEDNRYKEIPLLCFCGKRSKIARIMDENLAHATELFGADKYISLDHFCMGDSCDFDSLRREIEVVLV